MSPHRSTKHIHRRRGRVEWSSDRGSVTVLWAFIAGGMLMFIGTVGIDGGRKIGALREASYLASNAARAAGQALESDSARTGDKALDPDAARATADGYLAAVGHAGSTSVEDDTVTVTVTITLTRVFLPGTMTATAVETARARGIQN